ncbi:hypothetical protein RJZ56_005438 [Blastomyces dermatitidis]
MDDSSLYALISQIRHSDLPEEWKELIISVLLRGDKINLEGILRIWRITNPLQGVDQKVLWLEDGSASAGYQHMLNHAAEFEELGITKDRLAELAEAATTVGYLGGMQGHRQPGRPIFALSFYGKLVAVAISVGSNGFVIGMNRSSLDRCLEENNIRRDELADLASWPEVKE